MKRLYSWCFCRMIFANTEREFWRKVRATAENNKSLPPEGGEQCGGTTGKGGNDLDAARRKTRLGTGGLENAGWRQHRAKERHPGPLTTLAYKLWFLIILRRPTRSILFTTFFPSYPGGDNQYRKLGRLSMSFDIVRLCAHRNST